MVMHEIENRIRFDKCSEEHERKVARDVISLLEDGDCFDHPLIIMTTI